MTNGKNSKWVCNLYREVKQIKARRVTLLACNKNYLHILVNWLAYSVVYAIHPVNSILIIAFDSFTHSGLRYKGFHSVHISLQAVANSRTNESVAHIWITRLTVARLLNHWNHSVLLFDSDAIVLYHTRIYTIRVWYRLLYHTRMVHMRPLVCIVSSLRP